MSEAKCKMVGLLDGKGNESIRRVYSPDGASPTLNTCQGGDRQCKIIDETNGKLRVRYLTPLEYWRLMGFDDEDYQRASDSGVSRAQLYKQAGNSIVVNVLEAIFKEML